MIQGGFAMEERVMAAAAVEKIRNIRNHNCFGCSPTNDKGLRMEFFPDGDRVCSIVAVPAHCCGWDKLVHGGVITTIMDEVMSWTAIYRLKVLLLTKSISVDFLRPVMIEKPLRAVGRVAEITSDREAVIEGFLYNEKGKECARSKAVIATFTSETIRNLGFMNRDLLAEFEEIMKTYP